MTEQITKAIIVLASLIIACRAWYFQGYIDALKEVRKMLKEARKEQE